MATLLTSSRRRRGLALCLALLSAVVLVAAGGSNAATASPTAPSATSRCVSYTAGPSGGVSGARTLIDVSLTTTQSSTPAGFADTLTATLPEGYAFVRGDGLNHDGSPWAPSYEFNPVMTLAQAAPTGTFLGDGTICAIPAPTPAPATTTCDTGQFLVVATSDAHARVVGGRDPDPTGTYTQLTLRVFPGAGSNLPDGQNGLLVVGPGNEVTIKSVRVLVSDGRVHDGALDPSRPNNTWSYTAPAGQWEIAESVTACVGVPNWTTRDTVAPLPGVANPMLVPAGSGLVVGYGSLKTESGPNVIGYRRHTATGWGAFRPLTNGISPYVDSPAFTATDALVRAVVPTTFDGEKLQYVVDDGTRKIQSTLLTSTGYQPTMVTDANGLTTVAAVDSATDALTVWTITTAGTVSTPAMVTIPSGSGAPFSPSVTLDPTGSPVLTFGVNRFDGSQDRRSLWTSKLSGGAWTAPVRVVADPDLLYFDTTSGHGRIVMSYTVDSALYVREWTARGTFGPAVLVSSSAGGTSDAGQHGPRVAVASDGRAAIVMGDTGDVFTSDAPRGAWQSAPAFPISAPGYCHYPIAWPAFESGQLVAAESIADAAGDCSIVESQLGPAIAPDAPTAVVATPTANRVRVRWVAPARFGGSPVTAYTVTLNPGGRTMTVSASATTVTFSGVAAGTYLAGVTASSTAGTSVAGFSKQITVG